MHAPGVVGHQQASRAEVFNVSRKIGAAREIDDARGIESSGNFMGNRGVPGGAEKLKRYLRQSRDQRAPMRDRPAFRGGVFRAGNEADAIAG
jgi:hypothetical protein